jgi:protein SCO1/2
LTSTLLWWTFAFMPLPSTPPEWLTAARYACFGSIESGVPAAWGWMLLVLAPASFLVAIFVLWGSELAASVRAVARLRLGQCLLAALAVALVVEATWVTAKLRTARAVASWDQGLRDLRTELPPEYPRQTAPAPELGLVDQHGRRISLASFKGRPVVLTFVFGHCQTLCPLVVETIKRAQPGAAVLLVTLDPWRDTPSALPAIARQWEIPENFHVLSSRSGDEVLSVARAYRVPFERNEKSGDIVHPGLVFLIDAEGRLAYTFNNPPTAWVREGLARLGRTHAQTG